ncbi:mannose-6-phosphate isomerase [Rhizoctonia solani AG-1 IB]|uniref:Mannose-6-phosphate isomerase n=2 Tax=Thanatephorus cucumeris (strain AG1-IB / isolate 7/3/14) TaxID=1108050 RepID=A0A0B7FMQ7_THACB|nr:mannose-6-phosphate isomerase [Rhizoctonia solani AG-1 IB]
MTSQSVFRIVAGANSYDWGKIGKNSKAGQYARADPEFKLQEDKPYSELWMGTHPTLPSKLQSGEKLYDHLQAHPELLGDKVHKQYGGDLPFLFKVLAIEKALSIQAHPNKKLAEKLHKERPDVYKDDNHKPEMAIAITPFSGFCNFRPLSETSTFLSSVPEFASLIPDKAASALSSSPSDPKSALRDVFGALMSAPSDQVQSALDQLIKRYESGGATPAESDVADLAQTLAKQYPGDVGVFCVFLLNVVKLNEGEAMFLQADEPHAYISGDIIECMATSDNVVRAGLTPKLRDVPTLVSMLTYNSGPADAQRMEPKPFKGESNDSDSYTTLYDPPIPEFSVLLTNVPAGKKASHRALDGPSIFIVTSGSGSVSGEKINSEGEVWFASAGQSLEFTAGDQGLVLYRAFVEVS